MKEALLRRLKLRLYVDMAGYKTYYEELQPRRRVKA